MEQFITEGPNTIARRLRYVLSGLRSKSDRPTPISMDHVRFTREMVAFAQHSISSAGIKPHQDLNMMFIMVKNIFAG